jgi:glycosyltransferase involved in cell wall biosynthesis
MIEAMACGTPVIAFGRGSVPEIVEDGVTGFIVEDEAAAVEAVGRLSQLDRREIRRQFERRFTAARMARDYVGLYEMLVTKFRASDVRTVPAPMHHAARDESLVLSKPDA